MSTSINTNFAALSSSPHLEASLHTHDRAPVRMRAHGGQDDAAELSIADRMQTQVRGMGEAVRNANDAIGLAQTADSGLGKLGAALQRMRELTIQARSAGTSDADKASLDREFGELAKEIQRITGTTIYNSKAILGDDAAATTFQVGSRAITVATTDLAKADPITRIAGTDDDGRGRARIDSNVAEDTVDGIDRAIGLVADERAAMGKTQSRVDSVIADLRAAAEKQAAVRRHIIDAELASQVSRQSRAHILGHAGSAMAAQANLMPQNVLALLDAPVAN